MHAQHQSRPQNHERKSCCQGPDTPSYTKVQKRWPLETGLQWGSDPSFCYHGFSCPIGTWTEERVTQNLMRNMASMANSVTVDFGYELDFPTPTTNFLSDPPDVICLNKYDFAPDMPSSHRSETPSSRSASFSTAASLGASSPENMEKKPEGRQAEQQEEENTQPPKKKRKCVQKPGQQLCHCRSEKKRREAVSQGYRELSDLVPGLKNHNFTRKYILDVTAKYVASLLQGNEDLERQLEEMEAHEEPNVWQFMEKEDL
ncbi:hypothetical protein N7532_003502 [Penicillium argentinense]|uniref:BHLH domain-containing protein n=1 Tax=Penicillium argentinense TaxID=1131581 RepID=A0A9W9KEQ2_9EURO|nr:uncharacterized protein N7532_003502 [Penicillium argentinense]KAJ5102973.1 hypothetical protein N7532_003502 [Penicillium argentinense]